MCGSFLYKTPSGDLAHNPGMCPDWESNRPPFDSQASTQSTEPHQPEHKVLIKSIKTWGSWKETCPNINSGKLFIVEVWQSIDRSI